MPTITDIRNVFMNFNIEAAEDQGTDYDMKGDDYALYFMSHKNPFRRLCRVSGCRGGCWAVRGLYCFFSLEILLLTKTGRGLV